MEHRNIQLIELKGQIEKAIRGHVSQMSVPKGTTQNDVYQCIRSIMRENPDIFWYAYQWKYLEQKNTIQLEYIFPKSETEEIKGKINDVINNDFQIDYVCTLSKWEKVMYVYKWIISNCNYNLGSAYNQCIYSVFVLRNSVCSGYSKAAQYLFKLLDFDSILVYGKLKGSEDGSKHCWNLIDIDGKQYHLDVSFGDTALNSLLIEMGVLERMKIDEINYNFFCVSSQEIQKSRIIFELDDLPEAKNTLSFLEIEKLSQIQLMLRQSDKSILLSTKGTTAEIYLCSKDKNTVLKCYRDTSSNHCWEEYRFMDRLRGCPHLLHVNDKYCDIGNGVIALEQAVPVSEIIKSPDNVFTLKDALFMIRDIALAVDECYWYNTYYRDIHLNNIYKTSDGLYKLADFGSCSWVIQMDALFVKENVEGSPWFMAPETYENGVFDLASATYSLSLLLYFVLNDLTPPFWNEYYDKRAYQKRYEGEPIPSLLLDFDEDVSKEIVSFLEKGLAFNEADRYKGMHAYISNIENLIDILGKRDFSLQLSKDESFFNRTVYPRFHEGCCTTGVNSVSFDENEEDFVPTEITCPNCNHVYLVELAKELYKNIRPMLCSDSANGGLSIIRKDTDYVTCPNCSYKVSIGECIENHIISLPLKNNCYQKEDFSTMFIHTRKNACTYFPTCISYDQNGIDKSNKNPDFSTTHIFIPKRKTTTDEKKQESLWRRIFGKNKKQKDELYKVYSSIFAPAEVKSKSRMIVQVYLHLYEETENVMALALESDKNTERRDYIPLQCKLKKGDKVDVQLNIYGETLLMSGKKSVVWQGSFTKCSFDYFVPKDIDVDELSCVAMLTVNGVPVGEMRFITRIVDAPRQLNPEVIAHKYNKVFISYAHKDEAKVKSFHEGLKLAGIEHFFDRAYLKTGDIFPQVIQDYINSADLFVLFWSENASKSEYVDKERKQALERAFPQVKPQKEAKLSIYPMSIEPRAELPGDMRENYHFGEI